MGSLSKMIPRVEMSRLDKIGRWDRMGRWVEMGHWG